MIISPLRTAGARSNVGSGFVYPSTSGGSRIIVDVACNDSDGNQRPSRGNRFFILASTMMRPVMPSTDVVAETCESPAMAVAASDGLSDVIAERTALRAMSFSRNVSRHTDNVARSNTAHNTTRGAINANSTVACPLSLRRGA